MRRLNLSQLLVLNAYWVGLSFMWNAIHPILLPAVLLNYVPDAKKNTYLGLLTFAGLIIAMIIQPISGALSDGWKSRFGRRRPLIVFGTVFDFLFLSVLAWAGGFAWLFIGYIGLQFSSNIAHGPLQGLLPDRVPQTQLGVASSLKTFMDMLALIIASLLAGRLLDPVTRDPTPVMLVVMSLLAVSAAITIVGTTESPSSVRAPEKHRDCSERSGASSKIPRQQGRHGDEARTGVGGEAGFLDQFKINFRHNSSYWWLIAERALFILGIYGVQAFAQYYLQDVLRVPDPPKQTGDLLAALTITLTVLVLIGGWLTDKYGAKRILLIGTLIAAGGLFLMLFARDMRGLLIFGSVLGAGIGLFLTSNWALANTLAPEAEAGKYLGLTNLATAGSGAPARLEGPALDWLNAAWPGAWIGYKGLFVFGALCMLLSVFLLRKIDVESGQNNVILSEATLAPGASAGENPR
ncbi:MAG TPA: MFS transporter [Anaerolineales bacterium]|nr:MFS transporter [Anaerolineales bacterium]